MLEQKIPPPPPLLTACMYRSSVVSSVTTHRVQTATATYIQVKVWSFSNITKYIYVYIIIALSDAFITSIVGCGGGIFTGFSLG